MTEHPAVLASRAARALTEVQKARDHLRMSYEFFKRAHSDMVDDPLLTVFETLLDAVEYRTITAMRASDAANEAADRGDGK